MCREIEEEEKLVIFPFIYDTGNGRAFVLSLLALSLSLCLYLREYYSFDFKTS